MNLLLGTCAVLLTGLIAWAIHRRDLHPGVAYLSTIGLNLLLWASMVSDVQSRVPEAARVYREAIHTHNAWETGQRQAFDALRQAIVDTCRPPAIPERRKWTRPWFPWQAN